jgi:hypothetical protein
LLKESVVEVRLLLGCWRGEQFNKEILGHLSSYADLEDFLSSGSGSMTLDEESPKNCAAWPHYTMAAEEMSAMKLK